MESTQEQMPDNGAWAVGLLLVTIVLVAVSWFSETTLMRGESVAVFKESDASSTYELVDAGAWIAVGGAKALIIPDMMEAQATSSTSSVLPLPPVHVRIAYAVKDPQAFYETHRPNQDDLALVALGVHEVKRTERVHQRLLERELRATIDNFAEVARKGCDSTLGGTPRQLPRTLRDALSVFCAMNGLELLGGACEYGS